MPRSAGRVPAPLQAATPQAGVGLALHAVLKAAASKQGRKSTQGYVASGYTASPKQLKPLLAGGAHCSHPRLSPTLAPSWGAAVKQLLPCPDEPADLFQRERKCFFPMRSSSLGEQMPREPRHQRLSEVKHEAKKRPAAQPPASCPSPRGTLSSPISLSISHLFHGAAASSFYYSCTAPHTWCYIKRSGNEL